jgi:SAM-dependent methyltransferase
VSDVAVSVTVSPSAQALLSGEQAAVFDQQYLNDAEAGRVFDALERRRAASGATAAPRLVDLGGGNGAFCDRFLARYPAGEAVNVELARELVAANAPHPRKRVVAGSLLDVESDGPADLVAFNYVLHHLVTARFDGSQALVRTALERARGLLKPDGLLLVFENILVGALSDRLSSRLLFAATSSRTLSRLTAAFGANTAGVGVLYFGERHLIELATAAGFRLDETFMLRRPRRNLVLRPLLAREIRRTALLFDPAS